MLVTEGDIVTDILMLLAQAMNMSTEEEIATGTLMLLPKLSIWR